MEDLNDLLCRLIQYPEEVNSPTLKQQETAQQLIEKRYRKFAETKKHITLNRKIHVDYLSERLSSLSEMHQSIDSSRTWLLYFILHSLELLNFRLDHLKATSAIEFLKCCQNSTGGFGGGPGQISHLGTTYASVSALFIIGVVDSKAYEVIDREKLKSFISSCSCEDGSFKMGPDQETDVRAIYCALAVCRLTNIYLPEIFINTPNLISSSQNFDGGFGGTKSTESHCGYTFCAYASLFLMNRQNLINHEKLLHFLVGRQMDFEGGFQGRPGKLVDTCYSYWCCSLFPLIQAHFEFFSDHVPRHIYNKIANQYYLLLCGQVIDGGFQDFPSSGSDLYHTCYSLSALAISQYSRFSGAQKATIVGQEDSLLEDNNPLYNITEKAYEHGIKYFYS